MDGNNLAQYQSISLEQPYLDNLEAKKNFLQQNINALPEEEIVDKNAEIVFLSRGYENGKINIKNTPNQMVEDQIRSIIAGNYTQQRRKRITEIGVEIKRLNAKFGLPDNKPFPEQLYQYAFNPKSIDKLSEEEFAGVRRVLADAGYFSIYDDKILAHPNEEIFRKVRDDIHLNLDRTEGIAEYYKNHPNYNQIYESFQNHNLHADYTAAVQNDFLIYLMGREENSLSPEEAMNLTPESPDFAKYFNEFVKFTKDRPIIVSRVNGQKNFDEMMGVYKRCAEKIAEYRFPDIDYGNAEEVLKHEKELNFISSVTLTFIQEQDSLLNKFPLNVSRYPGGKEQILKDREAVAKLVPFSWEYKAAYDITGPELAQNVEKGLKKIAVNRLAFANHANETFRGKAASELPARPASDIYIKEKVNKTGELVMADQTITKDEVFAYLRGGNPDFAQKANPIVNNAANEAGKERNQAYYDAPAKALEEFKKLNNYKVRLKLLLDPAKTPVQISQDVFGRNGGTVQQLSYLVTSRLFSDNRQYELLNYLNQNPLSHIRIDGKTLEELYGQKYAHVQDPGGKEVLYRVELLNHIANGKGSITVDRWHIDENNRLVKHKPLGIIRSAKDMGKTRTALKEINALNGFMANHVNVLDANPLLNQSEEVTAAYNTYYQAAKDLRDAANLNSDQNNFDLLEQKSEVFLTQAYNYYDLRENALRAANASEEELKRLADEKKAVTDQVKNSFGIIQENALPEYFIPEEYENAKDFTFKAVREKLNREMLLREEKALNLEDEEIVYDGDFEFLSGKHDNETRFNDSQYELLEQALHIDEMNAVAFSEIRDAGNEIVNRPDYPENNMTVNAPNRVFALFCAYAMGEKGLSVEEATRLSEPVLKDKDGNVLDEEWKKRVDDLRDDFIQFCKDNPMKKNGPETDKEKESRLKNWSDVFMKAQKRIEEYRWPAIDYSDANQVSPHLRTINLFYNLSVNVVQETNSMMEANNVGQTLMAKCAGGEKKYWDMKQFYFTLQESVGDLFDGHKGVASARNILTYRMAAQVAYARYYCNKALTPFKGKTIGEFIKHQYAHQEYNQILFGNVRDEIVYENPDALPVELSISYLFGKNVSAFEKKFNERFNAQYDHTVNETLPQCQRNHFFEHITKVGILPIRELLVSSGDDAASMKALRNVSFRDSNGFPVTVEENINRAFSKICYNGSYGRIVSALDLNRSDLFLIEGYGGAFRTASEIWGEKYADIQDPDEKEKLYRLEIMKAIAKGTHTVKMRRFSHGKEGIKETPAEIITYGREAMEKMYDSLGAYAPKRDDLLSRLADTKEKLLQTQDSRLKNFGKAEEEGSTEYRNYTKALQNAIDVLQRDANGEDVSPVDIRRRLKALEETAAEYHRTHVGVFGPLSDNGILRLASSNDYKKGLVDEYNAMRRGFENDLAAAPTGNQPLARNASYAKILEGLNAPAVRNALGYPDIRNPEFLKGFVRAELSRKVLELKNRLETSGKKYTAEQELAKNYLLGYADIRINPDPDLQDPTYRISDLRKIDNFDDKVEELAANPVFIRFMKENPEKCIKEFHLIEDSQETLKTTYRGRISTVVNRRGSRKNYVGMIERGSQVTAEDALRAIPDSENPELVYATVYRRMAEVVVLDALTGNSEASKQLREDIAMNPDRYNGLITKAEAFLRSKSALEGRNIDKLEARLAEGKYSIDFIKHISEAEVRERKERERQSRNELEAAEAGLGELFNEDEDTIVTQDAFRLFDSRAGYSDSLVITNKLKAAAALLGKDRELPVKKEKWTIKVTSPDGVEEANEQKEVPVMETVNYRRTMANAGISTERVTSALTIFMCYVMAKKGLDPMAAYRICTAGPDYDNEGNLKNKEQYELSEEYRKEFLLFAKNNPTAKEDSTKEEVIESVKNWAEIYKAGTEEMRKYKFPEGNYRDPKDVKKNMEEISVFLRYCIDIDQEFDRILKTNNKTNTIKAAQEKIGGEQEYNGLKRFWAGISGALNSFAEGYGFMSPEATNPNRFIGKTSGIFRSVIVGSAAGRIVAGEELNRYNGKTLEQISRSGNNKVVYQKHFMPGIVSAFHDLSAGNPKLVNDSIKFMIGRKNTFADDISPTVDECLEKAKETFYTSQIDNAARFKNNLKFNALTEKLMQVPDDDFEAMKRFMEEEIVVAGETMSGAGHVENYLSGQRNGLFDGDRMTLCLVLGIRASDTILIDGRTPSQIWGEKYAAIEDAGLKEEYYRAEILKELALGRSDIEIRNFRFVNDELVEAPRQFIRPKNEKLQELVDGVHVYEAGREDLLNELKALKNRFGATQTDPEANFGTGEKREGNTEEYLGLTRCLNNLIRIFENEKANRFDRKTILGEFDSFLRYAQEYERTHTGLFVGRWGRYAADRVNLSRDVQKIAPALKAKYERLRKGFDSRLTARNRVLFRDGEYENVSYAVNKAETLYPGIQAKDENYYKTRYIESEITHEIENLLDKPLPNGPLPEENYGLAREYLIYRSMSRVQSGLGTFEDLKNIRDAEAEMKELAANEEFINWAKADKAACFTGWAQQPGIQPQEEQVIQVQPQEEHVIHPQPQEEHIIHPQPQGEPNIRIQPEIPQEANPLQAEEARIRQKGETAKAALENMNNLKGVHLSSGQYWQEKVDAFMDYLVAKEVERRGGLQAGENAESIQKQLFPTKQSVKTLSRLFQEYGAQDLCGFIERGEVMQKLEQIRSADLGKNQPGGDGKKTEDNAEAGEKKGGFRNEIHTAFNAPGK